MRIIPNKSNLNIILNQHQKTHKDLQFKLHYPQHFPLLNK